MQNLDLRSRLVVNCDDFAPTLRKGERIQDAVRARALFVADALKGTSITLALNYTLRACGYDIVSKVKDYSKNCRVMADLALSVGTRSLATEARLLDDAGVDVLSVNMLSDLDCVKALEKVLTQSDIEIVPTYPTGLYPMAVPYCCSRGTLFDPSALKVHEVFTKPEDLVMVPASAVMRSADPKECIDLILTEMEGSLLARM